MPETPPDQDYRALLQDAVRKIRELKLQVGELEKGQRDRIAVVGTAVRFPAGVQSPEEYWQLLLQGKQVASEVPSDRWSCDQLFDPDPDAPGKIGSRHGGFLDNVDLFDADFFGISAAEARSLDPQHRLLLEVTWEALENALHAPSDLYGKAAGVFVGISNNDYANLLLNRGEAEIDHHFGPGTAHSTAAGRISHLLGLRGPSLAVDTACSSSLVATHLACQSLRMGECDLALVGGVNLLIKADSSIYLTKAGLISPDGKCKTFAASADGVVRGEGCAVVVLKRLSDAQAQRDRILAVIRGSAVNHDGPSGGLTIPNGPAQQALIRKALECGGVEPLDVNFIEAHGAGTLLGDSIEIGALAAVYGQGRLQSQPLLVASHKTNLGHLEAAGGVAGLIKLAQSLSCGEIPPHLHLEHRNPNIPWDRLPIQIPTERTDWPTYAKIRVGAVSSFSFSGTNAHVVVEQPPPRDEADMKSHRRRHVLAMSTKTKGALVDLARRYAARLHEDPDFADVCFSANTGRSHFEEHRMALIASDSPEAAEKLEAHLAGANDTPGVFYLRSKPGTNGKAPTQTHDQLYAEGNVEGLAEAYLRGDAVDWQAVYRNDPHNKVLVPTYPFQRQRYWIEIKPSRGQVLI